MIAVFLGPTLAAAEAKRIADGLYLGPVSQGDVYRVSRQRPDAIAIVDGYFDRVPAVWHKEILWALASGIRVFGSSSMGALRAAELERFGMVGVGRIFESFRSGELEDDDEVALVHAAAEDGYRPLSEAMVNVRATLRAAEQAGVLAPAYRPALERAMKALHYADRRYPTMLAIAATEHLAPRHELDALAEWLPSGRVDQKAEDAIVMLRRVTQVLATGEPIAPVRFAGTEFAYTAVFDELRRTAGAFGPNETHPAPVFTPSVLDEARLAPDWERFYWHGLSRSLALDEAERLGIEVNEEHLFEAIVEFRRRRNLLEPADLEAWLAANELTHAEFIRLMDAETRVGIVRKTLEVRVQSEIADSLRVADRFAALRERAAEKHAIVEAVDANPPAPDVYQAALDRYGGGGAACNSLEVARLAAARGFAATDAFLRAVLIEDLYRRSTNERGDGTGSV